MSFISMLVKIDDAIDKGLAYADDKTAFIDKAEVFICRGKTADERCDQGAAIAVSFVKEDIKPIVGKACSATKNKACDLAGKAKKHASSIKDKVVGAAVKAKDKVKGNTEAAVDIPVIVDDSQIVPMARIVDTSHKTPIMDLGANTPRGSEKIPVLAQMNVFVENAKCNTPWAEMR